MRVLIPFSLVVTKNFGESFCREFEGWKWSQLFPPECWLIFTRINGVNSQKTNVHLSLPYKHTHKTLRHCTLWVITSHSLTKLMSLVYKHRYSVILQRPVRSGRVKWNVVRWFSGQTVHFSPLSWQSLWKPAENRYISPHIYPNIRHTFAVVTVRQAPCYNLKYPGSEPTHRMI
jgi:hypothetical protein